MDVKEYEPPTLRALADGNAVLNDHFDDAGLCAVCGAAWPCSLTRLAGTQH